MNILGFRPRRVNSFFMHLPLDRASLAPLILLMPIHPGFQANRAKTLLPPMHLTNIYFLYMMNCVNLSVL